MSSSSSFALPAAPINISPDDYAPRSHPGRRERMNQSTSLAVTQIGLDAERRIDEVIEEAQRACDAFKAKMLEHKEFIRERAERVHNEFVGYLETMTIAGEGLDAKLAKFKVPTL